MGKAPKPRKRTDAEVAVADRKAAGVSTSYVTDQGRVTVVTCGQCKGKGGPCCGGYGFLRQGELGL